MAEGLGGICWRQLAEWWLSPTAAIALLAAVVAAAQYSLSRRQWLLGLYEKRYPVFSGTMRFVVLSFRERRVTDERRKSFQVESWEHRFLFGRDVARHVDELMSKGTRLMEVEEKRRKQDGTQEELVALAEEEGTLVEYFGQQREATVRLFRRYLEVGRRGRMRRWGKG